MAASDEHPKHGEVLDEVLRDEIKDLPPEQIRQVLEYIGQLKEQYNKFDLSTRSNQLCKQS